LMTTAVYSKE